MRLYQNVKMPPAIEEAGCGVMCAVEMARQQGTREFSSPEECATFIAKVKAVDPAMFVKSWDDLFKALGMKVKCRYEKAGYVPKPHEDVIDKYVDARGKQHFVYGTYDPWYPSARTRRNGWIKERLVVDLRQAPSEPKGPGKAATRAGGDSGPVAGDVDLNVKDGE